MLARRERPDRTRTAAPLDVESSPLRHAGRPQGPGTDPRGASTRRRPPSSSRLSVDAPRVFMYGLGRSGLVARGVRYARLVHLSRGRHRGRGHDDAGHPQERPSGAVLADRAVPYPALTQPTLRTPRAPAWPWWSDNSEAPLAGKGDLVIRPSAGGRPRARRRQPMGSLFEQALQLLYLDSVVLRLDGGAPSIRRSRIWNGSTRTVSPDGWFFEWPRFRGRFETGT